MLFKNMVRHRNITPTDIDGFIDYNGQAFLFLEGKKIDANFPTGQRRSLEHLCDKISAPAACIVFEHNTPDTQDIDVSNCLVKQYYYQGKWYQIDDFRTVIEQVEKFEYYCTSTLKVAI